MHMLEQYEITEISIEDFQINNKIQNSILSLHITFKHGNPAAAYLCISKPL